MSSLPRLFAVLVAVVAAVVLVAACGTNGDEDVTENLTAEEVLAGSTRAWADVESFRVAFEVAGDADLGPSAAEALGGRVDVSGEGLVRPPDAVALDATVSTVFIPVQVGVTRLGDEVVLSALGQNIGIAVDDATLEFVDLRQAYPELADWMTNVQRADGESIDGTSTVALSGAIDGDRALAALGPVLGAGAPDPSAADAVAGTATVWVGTGDLVPRRIALTLRGNAARLAADAGALDVAVTVDIRDIGTSDEVVVPPVDELLTPERVLGSLLGG